MRTSGIKISKLMLDIQREYLYIAVEQQVFVFINFI